MQDLLARFSVEAAVRSPFEVRRLLKFKLSKEISEKDLCSLHPVFGQDPFSRSLSKISAYKDLAKNVKISFVPHIMIYHLSSKIPWQDTPFVKVSVEDWEQDLLDRFSVEAAVPGPFEVRPLLKFKFKLSKDISEKDLCSLHPVFGQDPFNRSLSKISAYKDLAKSIKISFVPQIKDLSSIIKNIVARYALCEGLCRRLLARSPWQVLCGSCCAKSLWSKTPVKVQAL